MREVDTGREYTESYDALALCPGADAAAAAAARHRPARHPRAAPHRRHGRDQGPRRRRPGRGRRRAGATVRAVVDRRRLHRPRDGREPRATAGRRRRRRAGRPDPAAARPRDLDPGRAPPAQPRASACTSPRRRPRSRATPDGRARAWSSTTAPPSARRPRDPLRRRAPAGPTWRVAAGLELGRRGGIAVDTHMRTSDPHIWAAGDAVETPHTVLPGQLPGTRWPARPTGRRGWPRRTSAAATPSTAPPRAPRSSRCSTWSPAAPARPSASSTPRASPYRAVHVHPSGHAGYYPGTADDAPQGALRPRHRRASSAPRSPASTASTSDSTCSPPAIRAGLTVYDLEELELAYAPPFGSAKDPVNMAGLRGDQRAARAT